MNTSRNETDEILSELTSIEFDDEDALTLLDDEEMGNITKKAIEDIDLTSLYSGDAATKAPEKKVDLYTEKVIPAPIQPKVEPVPAKAPVQPVVNKFVEKPQPPKQGMGSSANLDAYLNGALDNKNNEVKVEKITLPPTPKVEELVPQKPTIKTELPRPVGATSSPRDEKMDMDNLSQLFAKVSSNVRGASDIVNKNTEIKKKIDERFVELQKLQEEHERNKQSDYAEINAYKDDVYTKLKEKKAEVEEQLALLKKSREAFELEKQKFEKEKTEAMASITKREQDLNQSYQERMRGIEQIEEGLVKRKEQLDLERATIQKERLDCENEKKDLASNLLKFNQLVDDFTKGVDRFNETN